MPLHIGGTPLDEEISALTISDTTRLKEAVETLMQATVEAVSATLSPMQARALLSHMVQNHSNLMRTAELLSEQTHAKTKI